VSFSWEDLFGGGDPQSLFEEIFGVAGGAGVGGGARARRRRRGRDVESAISVPFTTAMLGGPHRLKLPIAEQCTVCRGTGREAGESAACPSCGGRGVQQIDRGTVQFAQTCAACGGTGQQPGPACGDCGGRGFVERPQEITVRIPPGVPDGQRLRLRGKGEPGPGGGSAGDLYLRIHTQADPELTRDGDDIRSRLYVTPAEAAAGTKVEVRTLDGRSTLTVPPNAQSGQKLRMRGKGVPDASGRRGDHLVELLIRLPPLDDEQIAELRRWEAGFDPRG
jgi:molecular chaperone DnaJ